MGTHRGRVEVCDSRHRFDLITLRMVAEHIQDPDRSIARLAELLKPGGLVVIYNAKQVGSHVGHCRTCAKPFSPPHEETHMGRRSKGYVSDSISSQYSSDA